MKENLPTTRVNKQGYSVLYGLYDRNRGHIYTHVVIAEMMFGGPLPKGMTVHHLDGDKLHNIETNYMVCSHAYHQIQHKRMGAVDACGVSWYLKCPFCKEYDHPENMHVYISNGRNLARHRKCVRKDQRERYKNNPEPIKARQRKYHAKRLEGKDVS